MNLQGVELERRAARPALARLYGLWSVAVVAGAGAAGLAAHAGLSAAQHFGLTGLLLAVLAGLSAPHLLPAVAEAPRPEAHPDPGRRPGVYWSVAILSVIGFASFFAEGATADWSGVYLRDYIGTEEGVATTAFLAFSAATAAVLFVTDRLRLWVGAPKLLVGGAGIALAGLALAPLTNTAALVSLGFGLVGLGIAPMTPLVISAGGRLAGIAPERAVAHIVSISYLGAVLSPPMIGLLADQTDLRLALALPALFLVGAALLICSGPTRASL